MSIISSVSINGSTPARSLQNTDEENKMNRKAKRVHTKQQ